MPTFRPSSPARIVKLRRRSASPRRERRDRGRLGGCRGAPGVEQVRVRHKLPPGVTANWAPGLSPADRMVRPIEAAGTPGPHKWPAEPATRGPGNHQPRRASTGMVVTRSRPRLGGLDLDVHTGWKAQLVEGVDRLVCRLNDI